MTEPRFIKKKFQNRRHLRSVYWSTNQATIGEEVILTALLKDIVDGDEIAFIVSCYNGLPARIGRTTEEVETVRVLAKARNGVATATWKVSLHPLCFSYAGIPTFFFHACWRSETSLDSPILTLGSILAVEWIDSALREPRPPDRFKTQAYFKDSEGLTIRVRTEGLIGFRVHFLVTFKTSFLLRTDWRPVWEKEGVPVFNGEATAVFRIEEALYDSLAFGSFRCDIALSYGANRIATETFRSGIARHYATRFGIWGLDPSAPFFANTVIRSIAQSVHALAVPDFPVRIAKLVANQISPEEKDFRIFGFDHGAVSLLLVCRELEKRNINVTLIIGIDPISRRDDELVPDNVAMGFCYYQRNGASTSKLRANVSTGIPYRRSNASMGGLTNEQLSRIEGFLVFHEALPNYVRAHRNLEAMLSCSVDGLQTCANATIAAIKATAESNSGPPKRLHLRHWRKRGSRSI